MGIRKAFITTIVLCASCLCVAYAGEESQRQVAGESQLNNVAKFNLATYNIRYYSKRDSLKGNTWERRSPQIAQLARYHGFDIFGTQECLKFQLEDLKRLLPGFDYIGVGRDDGGSKGEHAAIFFDTSKFSVVDHGDFWLSETPDVPGRGWDAAYNRVCTWGRFRHKDSGKEFLYFNLHMDHKGRKARLESGRLIQKKIKEFGSDLPVFLSGDFNVDQTNECYLAIARSDELDDAYERASFRHAPNGTWNNWKPGNFSISRIDHIFVSPQVKVGKYGILTDTYLTAEKEQDVMKDHDSFDVKFFKRTIRVPSDHYPVMIEVEIP